MIWDTALSPRVLLGPRNQVWTSLRQTTAMEGRGSDLRILLHQKWKDHSVWDDPSTTSLLSTLNMKQDGGTTEHRNISHNYSRNNGTSKPVGMSWNGWNRFALVEVYGSTLGSTLGEVYGSMMGVCTPYSILHTPYSVCMGVHWEWRVTSVFGQSPQFHLFVIVSDSYFHPQLWTYQVLCYR